VELEILRLLESKLNGISIKSFFDLIVGTRLVLSTSHSSKLTCSASTGGIIALGLVANDWSVSQCTQRFQELCSKAFTSRTGSNIPGIGFIVEMHNHSRYETQPLQEALIDAYDQHYLFGGERKRKSRSPSFEVKVAVTSTSTAGNAMVLANYNRPCREKCKFDG
jgi:patatin-like phospholipase/acyl hydrolase